MKVQADTINGVYKIDDFSTDAQVIDEELFYGLLPTMADGEIMAATLSDDMVAKITEEYGIT